MKKELTQREMASLGGKQLLKKYGKGYFKELRQKGIAKKKELNKNAKETSN
tara:strand:+ start:837 stop:989 length:153 start_codon:yes stop_codon:yes gene_type:complete